MANAQNQEFSTPREVRFDEKSGYLRIELDKEAYGFVNAEFSFQDKDFEPKKELHITILGQGAADEVRRAMEAHPGKVRQVKRLIGSTDWSYRKFQRFYQARDEQGAQSIIQMVEVPALHKFFEELSRVVDQALKTPPVHVTLYTYGDPEGIGLSDRETFEKRVTGEVSPKVLQQQLSRTATGSDEGEAI